MVGEDRFPDFLRVKTDALAQNRVQITEDEKGSQTLVGSGFPSVETKLEIVNPESLTRCAADEIGEVWISGPSVGMGYWQRPEETAETFMAYLADTGEGPFLRSGDLGFIRHRQLFIAGRLKDLIIIDGQNHYPQDIELTVEASHPALRAGHSAAFAIDLDGEERLVIVAELERSQRHASKEMITDAIRRCVSEENGLGIHRIILVKTGSIPKTSSGKIQRQGCRASYLAGNVSEEN
jgi:acyl-CoA synthetase (AMP-forming)/AMP-acid ligase II